MHFRFFKSSIRDECAPTQGLMFQGLDHIPHCGGRGKGRGVLGQWCVLHAVRGKNGFSSKKMIKWAERMSSKRGNGASNDALSLRLLICKMKRWDEISVSKL